MIQPIYLYGSEVLRKVAAPADLNDKEGLKTLVQDLWDTLDKSDGCGLAAPQIGVQRRLLYMYTDKPYVFVNPSLSFPDDEKYTLLDDCMSFPGLLVRVERYKRAVISYTDGSGRPQEMALEGDLSELLQHEYDHLDGILATMRAVDNKSFYLMEMKRDL